MDKATAITLFIAGMVMITPYMSLWNLSDIKKIAESIDKLTKEVKELEKTIKEIGGKR